MNQPSTASSSLLPSSSLRNSGGAPYLMQPRTQASNALTRNSSLRQPPREAGTSINSSRALPTNTHVSSLPPLIGAHQSPSRNSNIPSPAQSPSTPSPNQSSTRRFMQSISSPSSRPPPVLSASTANFDHSTSTGPSISPLSISTPNPPTGTSRLLRLDSLTLSPLSTTTTPSSRMMHGPLSSFTSPVLPTTRASESQPSLLSSPSTPTAWAPTVLVTQPPEPLEQPVVPPTAPPEDMAEVSLIVSPPSEALASPAGPVTPSDASFTLASPAGPATPSDASLTLASPAGPATPSDASLTLSLAPIPEDVSAPPTLLQPFQSSSDSLASSTSQEVVADPETPMREWAVRVEELPGMTLSRSGADEEAVDLQSVNDGDGEGEGEGTEYDEAGDSCNNEDDMEDDELQEEEEEDDDCFNPDDLARRAFSDSHFHFTYSHPSMADQDLWSRYAMGRNEEREEGDAMEVDEEEDNAEDGVVGDEERISGGSYGVEPQYQAVAQEGEGEGGGDRDGDGEGEGEGEDTFPVHGSEMRSELAPRHPTLETSMNLADSIPLQNWTQHAARMLLPHSMRDLADLLMGDGWRPGIADPLPSFPLPPAPSHHPSLAAAPSAGGASTSYGAPQHNRGRSRIFSKLAKAQDEAALLADLAASTKVVPASELLGGRQPQKHVKQIMSDAELVTQLLRELPGVDPTSAAVKVACAALSGKGVQARLLTSYN